VVHIYSAKSVFDNGNARNPMLNWENFSQLWLSGLFIWRY